MMDNSNFNRVQAVINLDNIRDNITAMKRLIDGDKKMLAVIKADAYGHGAVEVAEALDDLVVSLQWHSSMRLWSSEEQI